MVSKEKNEALLLTHPKRQNEKVMTPEVSMSKLKKKIIPNTQANF
jgi:hypothetical protein